MGSNQSPSARMSVLVGEKFACIKIAGRANFSSSIDFRTVVDEMLVRHYDYFVLELSECLLMDSTFLGVLAGFGLKMSRSRESNEPAIELLNPNARVSELLESLGVLHLFKVSQGLLEMPTSVQALPQPELQPSKVEVAQACLEAHQKLMEINPANVARFKDLAQFLAEDLKKLRNPTQA
jgi:anti-sigma B factor antagonist